MRPLKIVVAAGLLTAAVPGAETEWLRLQSANFELLSNAGERNARNAIRHFEMVRGFFVASSPANRTGLPIRVIAFSNEKEYREFRIASFAIAHYQATPTRDLIVMGRLSEDVYPVAIHEYVHLLIRHTGLKPPVWLNEGLAEFYATLKPYGTGAMVGDLHHGRLQQMRNGKWAPLEAILSADRESPYYNEKSKASALYNESWALVHMLSRGKSYANRFSEFLSEVSRSEDSATALLKVYGKTPAQLDKELRDYVNSTTFQAAVLDIKLQKSAEQPLIEPAPRFDVAMMLADLKAGAGAKEEAVKSYQDIARDFPDRPEPHESLAYHYLRSGKRPSAVEEFGKAYAANCRNPRSLLDYAHLLRESGASDKAPGVLERLLSVDPSNLDARLFLSALLLEQKDYAKSLEVLKAVRHVSAESAVRFFHLVAVSAYYAGDRKESEAAVRRWLELAKTDEERRQAQAVEQALQAPAETPSAPGVSIDSSERPRLSRTLAPTERPAGQPLPPSLEGDLVQLECLQQGALLHLATPDGVRKLRIDDASAVSVIGAEGGKLDLNCGPLARRRARVEYQERPGAEPLLLLLELR